jgi:hypothetical protein
LTGRLLVGGIELDQWNYQVTRLGLLALEMKRVVWRILPVVSVCGLGVRGAILGCCDVELAEILGWLVTKAGRLDLGLDLGSTI